MFQVTQIVRFLLERGLRFRAHKAGSPAAATLSEKIFEGSGARPVSADPGAKCGFRAFA
jgi:hypothetical protein